MNTDDMKQLIGTLGFSPLNGASNVYMKSYSAHNGYAIKVDFNENKIEYCDLSAIADARIRLGDTSTSNFSKPENFVVLECVNRLLEKGYAPSHIELEKSYPLGRKEKGKLDILVYHSDAPYLMVECKTWGAEFDKEQSNMIKSGGQLFSYYAQDRAAKYLCLYTSHIDNGIAVYRSEIVAVQDGWKELSATKDIHEYWDKNFRDNGIFEDHVTPYRIRHKALTYGMLQNLKGEDSGKIFNQISEILRHNAISDKPNAFNKLLNLFVCKIIDENRNEEDELDFQWLETDTDESLQMRLNDLYKKGMWRFLEIDVIDHSEEEVTKALEGIDNEKQKQLLKDMFRDTRLKKSPNFAFAEVLDNKTFELNAKIVREIVELLQVYKFRYEQKHEFLGNFFELLLNTSMKQETGQYFTPVPITRFIISSLPLKEFVQKRIEAKKPETLPTVMDYACGSGHFLTEYMSQMQNVIEDVDIAAASPDARNKLRSWAGDVKFSWAKDTVYGIDLDNRLVKTTKVSAFFNGDGDAEIIWANGLDNFEKSEDYRGKLKYVSPADKKNNGQFDILISNPPYSVEAFKNIIKNGEDSFELFESITDNGSEIECLFVERMKQLLKEGGWASIVLPSSILSNGGIYAKTRAILFKYFKVKAIAEMGSGTFMETGTNTVILFLERRSDNDHQAISRAIDKFFSDGKDVTVAGIENAFSIFVSSVYENLEFEDYLSFVNSSANENMITHELFLDYAKVFGGDIYSKAFVVEKEKMLYFLLTYAQTIVLVKSGQQKDEKEFLGYEFSKRRGHEGMKLLPTGTKLYDEGGDLLNPQKVSSYVYNAFLEKSPMSVALSLTKHVSYGRMSDLFEYGTNKFDRRVNLSAITKIKIESKYPLEKLLNLCSVIHGGTPDTSRADYWGGDIPWLSVADFSGVNRFVGAAEKTITKLGYENSSTTILQPADIIISARGTVGAIAQLTAPMAFNQSCYGLHANEKAESGYLFYALSGIVQQLREKATGSKFKAFTTNLFETISIPLPPLEIQRKIVSEIEAIEEEENKIAQNIEDSRKKKETIFEYSDVTGELKKLGSIVECNPSKSELNDIDEDTMISFVEMASVSEDGYIQNAVERRLSEVRKGSYTYFRDGDIIIAKITPCMENGKCALAIGLKNCLGMGSSEFHVFRCSDIIAPHYLFGYLNREIIRENARGEMTGASGHRRVPISYYQQLQILLPPIEKQNEIIAEIEKHEAEIKQLKTRLAELKVAKEAVLTKYLRKC
ncbi:restriction endonuclease [Clostridia bacterium]|nr:restriction endonuclease [Clostridia bacterium]